MNENPKEMTIAKLEVLVMPNGEILCGGQHIGYIESTGRNAQDPDVEYDTSLGKYLSEPKNAITGEAL